MPIPPLPQWVRVLTSRPHERPHSATSSRRSYVLLRHVPNRLWLQPVCLSRPAHGIIFPTTLPAAVTSDPRHAHAADQSGPVPAPPPPQLVVILVGVGGEGRDQGDAPAYNRYHQDAGEYEGYGGAPGTNTGSHELAGTKRYVRLFFFGYPQLKVAGVGNLLGTT
jgi:hypothetical protein